MHYKLNRLLYSLIIALGSLFVQPIAAQALNAVELLPDSDRPRLYAINNKGKDVDGSILVMDTLTKATIRDIPVGKEPTDMDLTENSQELLVMNTADRSISRINLTTLAVTTTYQLTEFDNRNDDYGGHVVDGPGNIIYYVDEQWGPRLRVYDTSTRSVLQTFGATSSGTGNDYGFGDIVVSPDKTKLFGWVQYGDGAGWAGSFVVRYDIAANGTLTFVSSGKAIYPGIMREPLDSKALMTAEGSRLVIKNLVVDQTDLDYFPVSYPDTIYSVSPNGRIVATANAILPSASGEVLYSLPVKATVQTILPDYSSLVYFNGTTKSLVWLDLVKLLGSEALGLDIDPTDGATIVTPTRLEWFPITGITRYQVYLGNVRSVVEAATPTSASYLGEAAGASFALTSSLPSGHTYFWRVVPIASDGIPSGASITRSFRVSEISLSRSAIAAASVEGVSRHIEMITLQSATPKAWTAKANVPWITFERSNGSTPGNMVAVFNASNLVAGNYVGEITITTSTDSLVIPINLRLYAANFVISEADLELPWVYVISQESNTSGQPSFLMRINTATNLIESCIPCGRSVTDLAIHYQENRIYLTNWQTGILRAFDRSTFQQVQTYQFSPADATGYSAGDIWEVSAGKSGYLIVEESDQWIDMRLISTSDGQTLATGFAREGGGIFEPTGRYYYHGENDSSGASLIKYDIGSESFAEIKKAEVFSFSYYGSRKVVISGDGERIFWNGGVFDNNLGLLLQFQQEIIRSTLRGDLIFTSTKAYNGNNGSELATLPVTTSVMSVSGDQKKLYLFKNSNFTVVDLSTIAEVSPRGLTPGLANGSAVRHINQELSWTLEAAALSYNVYFGSSQSAVSSATKTSEEYLGNTTGIRWSGAMPPLEFGKSYWWRVDTVGFASTVTGSTWSFQIPLLDVAPLPLELSYSPDSPIPVQRLALASQVARPLVWTASTATPWIKLLSSSGNTPATLEFEVNSAGLQTGLTEGSITIQSSGESFSVPVRLHIIAFNITKLIAHPTQPIIYGIHTAGEGEGSSSLLEIDAATAVVLRSMPIGSNPTDADLEPNTEKLYISNWGSPTTRVIDVTNWIELPSLLLGTDVYELEVSPRGRIVTGGFQIGSPTFLWDSSSGEKLSVLYSGPAGGGKIDPTGNYYYQFHNERYTSFIIKYDISYDSFTDIAKLHISGAGSRDLIQSGDGARLFWQRRLIDSDLNEAVLLPAETFATTMSGDLSIGENDILWSDIGTLASDLPFASKIAAVSAGDGYLVRFNVTTKTLHSTAFPALIDLPGPSPRPSEMLDQSPDRLSWSPIAGATSYRVFIAADASALAAMTAPTASVTSDFYELPSPLAFGRFHSWRVDAITSGGTVTGKLQSFGIRFLKGPALGWFPYDFEAVSVSLSDHHLLVGGSGQGVLYEFDHATGATDALQLFNSQRPVSDDSFGKTIAMDAGKAAFGAIYNSSSKYYGGAAFVYRQGPSDSWISSGPLVPSDPLEFEFFGMGLAASGNQMLVGTGAFFSEDRIGRVASYITEPTVERIQMFSANDGTPGDLFGSTIAMEGNNAIILAPGTSFNPSTKACLYAFTRSTTTGLWTQSQKILLEGFNEYGRVSSALTLSGNHFAVNNTALGTVQIFSKNQFGLWEPTFSIQGRRPYNFGLALAMAGDQLFIRDTWTEFPKIPSAAILSFRRSGSSWIEGPVIAASDPESYRFGEALAIRDNWLVATFGPDNQPQLFQIDGNANHTPQFVGNVPSLLVAGRPFNTEILADDADGKEGLHFDIIQGPSWMSLANTGDGTATLSGVPTGIVDSVQTVQLRVRDAAGAQAIYTYRLTELAATSLPIITQEPTGGNVGEGQEVILSASASGSGPFTWQWYRGDQPIPGATQSNLIIGEIALDEADTYGVSVSNPVGQVDSSLVSLVVSPATRLGGDWPTFGGSSRHTGFHPARLGKHYFKEAWTRQIHPSTALNRVAVGNSRVFTSASSSFESSPSLSGLDLKTGQILWAAAIPSSDSISPTTYHDGNVYFQRGSYATDVVGPQLIALDAITGTRRWTSVYGSQWGKSEAPAVTDFGIWINSGRSGMMYGFNLDGSQKFSISVAQHDGITPSVSNGRLYSWVEGAFLEHNPDNGKTIWGFSRDTSWNRQYTRSISAVSGDSAVIMNSGEIFCFDLPSQTIRWSGSGDFQGSPAISGGRVYCIQNKDVVSFDIVTGDEGPVVTFPASIISGQPLLTMDYIFVASTQNTYIVDRSNYAIVRTLAGGGLLSFADGHLIAAGTDGTLRAWRATALEFVSTPPPIIANDRADDSLLDLAALLVDPTDTESLTWEITGNSNPAIFSSITIDRNGRFRITYAPYLSGSANINIKVSNSAGLSTTTNVQVTLPAPPKPLVTMDPLIRFNRATGLYDQRVSVKNIAARAISGFELTITGLKPGVSLHNATTAKTGSGIYSYNTPMKAGETVAMILHYYDPKRGSIPHPALGVNLLASTFPAAIGLGSFAVSRSEMGANRAMLIEFPSSPGVRYRIQYTEDMVRWKTCPEIMIGSGNTIQWIDEGPPSTDRAPASVPSRFYRVERLDP